MRILSSLLLVAALSVAAPAKALVFEFVISGPELAQGGTGTVTGRILGLEDNLSNQMADAVILDSVVFNDGSPLDLGLLSEGRDATQWTTVASNTFDVFGGAVQDTRFEGLSPLSGSSTIFQDALAFKTREATLGINGQDGFDFLLFFDVGDPGSISFSQVSAVPLPGAFGLLLAAIAGLGFVGRKRRARA